MRKNGKKAAFRESADAVRLFPVENLSPSEPKKRGNSRPETENEE